MKIIALVLPTSTHSLDLELIKGFKSRFDSKNYKLIIVNIGYLTELKKYSIFESSTF